MKLCIYVHKNNRMLCVMLCLFFEFLLHKYFYERHSGEIIIREESNFQVLRCGVVEVLAEVR